MNFKSKGAYNKWLAYGHASGEFAKTPGHQPVSIKGKKKKVEHAYGGPLNIPNLESAMLSNKGFIKDTPIFPSLKKERRENNIIDLKLNYPTQGFRKDPKFYKFMFAEPSEEGVFGMAGLGHLKTGLEANVGGFAPYNAIKNPYFKGDYFARIKKNFPKFSIGASTNVPISGYPNEAGKFTMDKSNPSFSLNFGMNLREGGDMVSTMGYRDDSPFRNSKSLNIYSPDGWIDMTNVSQPIKANGIILEANSGLNHVPPDENGVVKEELLIKKFGGNIHQTNPNLHTLGQYDALSKEENLKKLELAKQRGIDERKDWERLSRDEIKQNIAEYLDFQKQEGLPHPFNYSWDYVNNLNERELIKLYKESNPSLFNKPERNKYFRPLKDSLKRHAFASKELNDIRESLPPSRSSYDEFDIYNAMHAWGSKNRIPGIEYSEHPKGYKEPHWKKKEYGGNIHQTNPNLRAAESYTPLYKGPKDKVLTLKDDREWFNAHAAYSSDPKYNEQIREAVYSGKYGFNPYTGALHKLSKSKQGTPTEAERIGKEDRRVVEAHLASLQKQAENEWKQGKVEVQIPKEDAWNPYGPEYAGKTVWMTPEEEKEHWKNITAYNAEVVRNHPLTKLPGMIALGVFGAPTLGAAGEAAFPGIQTALNAPLQIGSKTIPGFTMANALDAYGIASMPFLAKESYDAFSEGDWQTGLTKAGETAFMGLGFRNPNLWLNKNIKTPTKTKAGDFDIDDITSGLSPIITPARTQRNALTELEKLQQVDPNAPVFGPGRRFASADDMSNQFTEFLARREGNIERNITPNAEIFSPGNPSRVELDNHYEYLRQYVAGLDANITKPKKGILGTVSKWGKDIKKGLKEIDEQLGKQYLGTSKSPQIDQERLVQDVNDILKSRELGIAKWGDDTESIISLKPKFDNSGFYTSVEIPGLGTKDLGMINLRNTSEASKNIPFSQILRERGLRTFTPSGKQEAVSAYSYGPFESPGLAKVGDFPYGALSLEDKTMMQGSGISGEFNAALNKALKLQDARLFSGNTGHTFDGATRYTNLFLKDKKIVEPIKRPETSEPIENLTKFKKEYNKAIQEGKLEDAKIIKDDIRKHLEAYGTLFKYLKKGGKFVNYSYL